MHRSFYFIPVCIIGLMAWTSPARAGAPPHPIPSAAASDSTGATIPEDEYVPKWYSMFSNLPNDWVRYGRETFRTENIPAFVGMAALTGALIVVDDRAYQNSHKLYDSSAFVRHTSDFFEYIGDGRPQFGLAGAFALYGFAMRDRRALRTASELVEAILACGAVVQVIKHVTGRQSPDVATEPRGVWDFFPNQIEYHKHVPSYDAFPSGHIATALTTLTVVIENYPELPWLKPVGYTVVGLIGVSMVNTGIHWYSDYPLGLALGYSFGMLAAHPEGVASGNPEAKAGLSFAPMIGPRGTGLSLVLSF